MFESYFAGSARTNEIISNGTTIDLDFYRLQKTKP